MIVSLLKNICYKPFESLFTLFIVTFLLVGLYRTIKGDKGTWTENKKYYDYFIPRTQVRSIINSKKNTPIIKKNNDSKGEIECRKVLETIFKKKFNKSRPNFLKNNVNGGHNLELDCYNEDLKLALEYNGRQHYEFVPFFHKNKEDFLNQKYRDDMKRRICEQKGITLIEVPYTIKLEDIEKFIKKNININK